MASDCLIAYLGMINYSIDNILHYPCVELQSVREGINKIIKKRHKPQRNITRSQQEMIAIKSFYRPLMQLLSFLIKKL